MDRAKVFTGRMWLKVASVASSCEHGDKRLDSAKGGEILE